MHLHFRNVKSNVSFPFVDLTFDPFDSEEITRFPENYSKLIQQGIFHSVVFSQFVGQFLDSAVLLKNVYNLTISPELRRIGAISLISSRYQQSFSPPC